MKSVGRVVPALWLVFGCANDRPPPPSSSSSLPAGSAARAGSELVSAATVARIASRQGLGPRGAVALALADALFATEARATLPLAATRCIERAAAARGLLEQLAHEGVQAGAPTPSELSELVRERWVELARPSAVRTTHALVMNDKPERAADALAVAEKLAFALRDVKSGEELIQLANAFPPAGFEIRAQPLSFVTTDGRVFERTNAGFRIDPRVFDSAFARAANALQNPGELSPVVKSRFGYHVIRLEERLPSAIMSEPELSERLTFDIRVRRADSARRQLLAKLRQASPVHIERAVDELTAQVQVP